VACADDAELCAVLPKFKRRVIRYGIDAADANLAATGVTLEGYGSRCLVEHRERRSTAATATADQGGAVSTPLGELTLSVPGRHSVLNALAAVAVGLELDVPFAKIASALAEFRGAERRFEKRGVVNDITVVDDYGHHPTEIAAVLSAARAGRPKRIVVAFQPHRYTRTRDLMNEFGASLAAADEVVLTGIYAASEEPIPGVTIEALAAAVNKGRATPVHLVARLDDMAGRIADVARPGDLVITLGAGSIASLAGHLVAELERRHGKGGA
jgi:UDP-N-acetylmuramate--alanine ligase